MVDEKFLIGYYRLSMEDDNTGDSNSIINQRKLIKGYISGVPELANLPFREFYDDGYSGATMERPGIKEVLELARKNRVQCIVVKDFSRFARNYIEMGTYLEQIFPFLGVRFISISDHYDSRDYRGKGADIDVQFKGLVADFYVKDQSAKVKAAYEARRREGNYSCWLAPYGYEVNPEDRSDLLIVEEEAAVVRRIYELASERYRRVEICRILNKEGIPTPSQSMRKRGVNVAKQSCGTQWTEWMVVRILEDRTYIGCMVYGKTHVKDPGSKKEIYVPKSCWKVIENHHKPIVSKELYEKVQTRKVRGNNNRGKYSKGHTIFNGYLKCGSCGGTLRAGRMVKGHVSYSCGRSREKDETDCFSGLLDNRILEYVVLDKIKEYLQSNISEEQIQHSIKIQHEDKITAYEEEIHKCKNELESIKKQNLQNYEEYRTGKLSREQFAIEKKQLEEEKTVLENKIQDTEALLISEEKRTEPRANIIVDQMTDALKAEKLTGEMLERYVKEIIVYNDGRIVMKWKELE